MLGRSILSAVLATVLILIATVGASAGLAQSGNPNPRVAPPQSSPYGMTYGEWGAEYWKWTLSIPPAESPGLDETGANCGIGQSGSVWFLAGAHSQTTTPLPNVLELKAVREHCTVPTGKALFFSTMGAECSEAEGNGSTEEELRACARGFVSGVHDLVVEVDGVKLKDLTRYYASSPLETVTLSADNVLGAPAGSYPFVAEGYYVMLEPLAPGQHTIHFAGQVDFEIGGVPTLLIMDVTYDPLTVQ